MSLEEGSDSVAAVEGLRARLSANGAAGRTSESDLDIGYVSCECAPDCLKKNSRLSATSITRTSAT